MITREEMIERSERLNRFQMAYRLPAAYYDGNLFTNPMTAEARRRNARQIRETFQQNIRSGLSRVASTWNANPEEAERQLRVLWEYARRMQDLRDSLESANWNPLSDGIVTWNQAEEYLRENYQALEDSVREVVRELPSPTTMGGGLLLIAVVLVAAYGWSKG